VNEAQARHQGNTNTIVSVDPSIKTVQVNATVSEIAPKNVNETKTKDSPVTDGSTKNDTNKKEDPQIAALKQTKMDFINTVSKGINNLENAGTDSNSFNLNILIGNTDSHIVNQNLRNNGSFNKK
jgi:hypothetical protein